MNTLLRNAVIFTALAVFLPVCAVSSCLDIDASRGAVIDGTCADGIYTGRQPEFSGISMAAYTLKKEGSVPGQVLASRRRAKATVDWDQLGIQLAHRFGPTAVVEGDYFSPSFITTMLGCDVARLSRTHYLK